MEKMLWIKMYSVATVAISLTGKTVVWAADIVVIPIFSDRVPTVISADQHWMDHNLGALRMATKSGDPDAYGSLYQWGRLADGHEYRTSPLTAVTVSSDVPGHGEFITVNTPPYDWRNPQNDSLWQGAPAINNPCPAGFRLPTETEWETERVSWGSNNAAAAFASPLELVVGGYRSSSSGTLNGAGVKGYYWSSTVSSTNARALYFDSSDAYMFGSFRAHGSSVRCIKD